MQPCRCIRRRRLVHRNKLTPFPVGSEAFRDGQIDTQETIETNVHDFASAGSGKVIPHGIYDVGRNEGYIHLNTSYDTSELACDSIAAWWEGHGQPAYPRATKLLIVCDGGGRNSTFDSARAREASTSAPKLNSIA